MQLTVSENFAPAVAGMPADNGATMDGDRVTCIATEDIPAGCLLVQASTTLVDGRVQVKLPDTGTERIMGVSLYNPSIGQRPAVGGVVPAMYKAGDVIPVQRTGRIWANFVGATAANPGDALRVRITDGLTKGHFSAVAADAANIATTLTSYRASVGTLVQVDLRLPDAV